LHVVSVMKDSMHKYASKVSHVVGFVQMPWGALSSQSQCAELQSVWRQCPCDVHGEW